MLPSGRISILVSFTESQERFYKAFSPLEDNKAQDQIIKTERVVFLKETARVRSCEKKCRYVSSEKERVVSKIKFNEELSFCSL